MELTPSRFPQGIGPTPAHPFGGTSSFTDLLRTHAPDLLPSARLAAAARSGQLAAGLGGSPSAGEIPHGTTIVAAVFRGGVLLAGDRRATSGNLIAYRETDKVFIADQYSAVGVAGTAGIGIEMVRLYAVQLQHYEKIEGVPLSLDGKTNALATMVRGNLEAALNGFIALPLFAGYDIEAPDPDRAGRIVSFDAAGGRYDEHAGYHAIGSGSLFAKSALKKLHDPDADADTALRTVVEALFDAADDDSGTGGPDMVRKLYPTAVTITGAEGTVKMSEDRMAEITEAVVAARMAGGRA